MPRKKKRESTRQAGETRGRKPIVDIFLQERHHINGVPYGPGHVRVREDLAAVLTDNESRVSQHIQGLLQPRAGLVRPGGQVLVHPDYFNQAWGQDAPRIIVPGA